LILQTRRYLPSLKLGHPIYEYFRGEWQPVFTVIRLPMRQTLVDLFQQLNSHSRFSEIGPNVDAIGLA
ncbi:MAG: hypothetical protein ACREDJ_08035, partial [Methylocella sp.]